MLMRWIDKEIGLRRDKNFNGYVKQGEPIR